MKSKLSSFLDHKDTPDFLVRFPIALNVVIWLNQLLTLRNWYIRRGMNKIFSRRTKSFSVLDAGCGYGDFLVRSAKKHPESTFTGIDSADANCAVLRAYCQYEKIQNVKVEQRDLEKMIAGKNYDIILCCTVLQYIADDNRVLKYFFEALRANGELLIYIPVNYRRILPFFRTIEKRDDFNYDSAHTNYHRYSTKEILEKVANAGFSIEQLSPAYNSIGALGFEISELLMWLIRSSPIFWMPLAGICYILFFPVCLAMYGIDYSVKNSGGNGLLITAKKTIV